MSSGKVLHMQTAHPQMTEQELAIVLGAECYRIARRAWATLRLANPADSALEDGPYLRELCDSMVAATISDLDQIFAPSAHHYEWHERALDKLSTQLGINIHM